MRLPIGEHGFRGYCRMMRKSAKRRELKIDLTAEQIKALNQQPCYYCGTAPSQVCTGYSPCSIITPAGRAHAAYTYNGIDRVDSTKGYTIDNCVPCCSTCNRMKSDLPYDEFVVHIKRILEIHKDT